MCIEGWRKTLWRVLKRVSTSHGERSLKKLTWLTSWSWISSLQNWEKSYFCHLSHLVLRILLWQPKQTHTAAMYRFLCENNFHLWDKFPKHATAALYDRCFSFKRNCLIIFLFSRVTYHFTCPPAMYGMSDDISCCSNTKLYLTLCDLMDCSRPGSLSFNISQNLLKFMSIESVMPSNYFILC